VNSGFRPRFYPERWRRVWAAALLLGACSEPSPARSGQGSPGVDTATGGVPGHAGGPSAPSGGSDGNGASAGAPGTGGATNGTPGGGAAGAGDGGRHTEGGNGGGSTPDAGAAGSHSGAAGTSGAANYPSGGSPATGGFAGSAGGTGGGAGTAATTEFALLFRDEFDSLDSARWQLMTHSWESNLALFSEQAVNVEAGTLVLRLQAAPAGTLDDTGTPKPYLGAEIRSRDTLTYGRVRARARLAAGSAVVSSLVTIYTPWPADDWNELDIECLGKDASSVQFNSMVYTGPPPVQPVTSSVSPTQDPHLEALGFNASADFHVYTIEWTPDAAIFSIDDVPRYTWTANISLMKLPQNVLMTIWASSSSAWAGPVNDGTVQASATYDWIELYRYTPPATASSQPAE
jgi:endo-1,3-1,4-beta-glycanase ExoK